MEECRKCGGRMSGPIYDPGQGCACHGERLVYTCDRCGYRVGKLTKDKQQPWPVKETP